MPNVQNLTFFHAPNSRSGGARILIEELGATPELYVLDLVAGQQRQPAYLAINPMGKVPALRHGEALITEQAAVYMYLAELYPQADLAPAIGDPLRGPYLRWMTFYGSCFEPAATDKALGRDSGGASMSPYGSFDAVIGTLLGQLSAGPAVARAREKDAALAASQAAAREGAAPA